jgi:DNA mismatch repair ATPase MutS
MPCRTKQTEAGAQFWDIKKSHMDTVLFFQKGKFVRTACSGLHAPH